MTEICAAGLISFPTCNRVGSVGIQLPKNNLMIYDNNQHKELSYYKIGEVCLQGPSRMIGYLNNEQAANVKHFFTLLGNELFTSYGKQFFTLYGKKIFTLYGKQFFTLPGREFFTSLSGSRLSRQVLCQLKTSGCLSR